MKFLFSLKEKIYSLFRRGGKGRRRWKREPFILDVTYMTASKDLFTGDAKVLDINQGGVCLSLQKPVNLGELLALRINPYAIAKFVTKDAVALDTHGRYLCKVVWARLGRHGTGYEAGCAFLSRANAAADQTQTKPAPETSV